MTRAHRGDEGISSLLGFIVALVVVAGSMAFVVYVVGTTPTSGQSEESRDLQGSAVRAVETLTTTAGQPEDWHTIPDYNVNPPPLKRAGLLRAGTDIAHPDKIERLQDSTVKTKHLVDGLDLDEEFVSIHVEANMVPVPLFVPPTTDTHAVAHFHDFSSLDELNFVLEADSELSMELFRDVNPGYEAEVHDWMFEPRTHPTEGLGDTVPDHAWFIETQLVPKMAGFAATFTMQDIGSTETRANGEKDAFDAYVSSSSGVAEFDRWNVLTSPGGSSTGSDCIPGDNGDKGHLGKNVLTSGYRLKTGSDCNDGIGHWRSTSGTKTTALLGPVKITGKSDLELSFDYLLDLEHNDEGTDDVTECWETQIDPCERVQPEIQYWNVTAQKWSRINTTGGDDLDACTANWDESRGREATGGNFQGKTVDLCEAEAHAGGKLWLAFHWNSTCHPSPSGDEIDCGSIGDNKHKRRGWFLDNIQVTADSGAKILYETDLEPLIDADEGETVFLASGVDHERTYDPAPDEREELTIEYIHRFTEHGGSLLALEPGLSDCTNCWLAGIGLEVDPSSTSDVTTIKPEHYAMRIPHDLPEDDDDYETLGRAYTGTFPTEGPLGERADMTVVQETSGGDATILVGQPWGPATGWVAATSFDPAQFDDQKLAEHLVTNLYTRGHFSDPTFTTDDTEIPEPGTTRVETAKRVLLVPVSEDGEFTLPLEVTVYVWPGNPPD